MAGLHLLLLLQCTLKHVQKPLANQPDTCLLPTDEDLNVFTTKIDPSNAQTFRLALTLVPLTTPVVAFASYDLVFQAFRNVKDAFRSWYAVDGGSLERELLIPVVNGVVNPAVSIVLATLVAATLNSLRQRQIQIRTLLNQEACDLRTLDVALESIFHYQLEERRTSRGVLRQYVTRMILESGAGDGAEISRTCESELDGLLRLIASSSAQIEGEKVMYDPLRFGVPGMVQSLNHLRAARLAALQTDYPLVHWIILSLLAMSLLLNFLIESDEAALQFLDSFQLHALFTIIASAMSAMASLCVDLNDPFRGNFLVTSNTARKVYSCKHISNPTFFNRR